MRTDPRIRQSLNRISTSLESASDNARTGCFTFTKSYLDPCLISLSQCCLPFHDRQHLHSRRGRSEYPFGFYDYDDEDEDNRHRDSGGFLAWGNDELDRLLAGGSSGYGGAGNRMYYGASGSSSVVVGGAGGSGGIGKRKSAVPGHDQDPTVIPQTSMFGFLARFAPFRGKGLRYKPSAANLQEHPQRSTGLSVVHEDETDDEQPGARSGDRGAGMGRKRSATNSSGDSVGESMRSRGDLWPSEDDDDAIPIGDDVFLRGSDGEDDGFLVLARRDRGGTRDGEGSDGDTIGPGHGRGPVNDEILRREEGEARILEEIEVEKKREAARRLAIQRGLSMDDYSNSKYPHDINPSAIPLPETLPSTRAPSILESPLPPLHQELETLTSPIQVRKEKGLPEIPTTIIIMPNTSAPPPPPPAKEIHEGATSLAEVRVLRDTEFS